MLNVVLVAPEIPQNTGNIARTCAATGSVLHLIRPLGFDISERAVRRAGLDYWHLVDVRVYDDLGDFYAKNTVVQQRLFSTKAPRSYCDVSYDDGCYLFFGRETKGLPEPFLEAHYDDCVRIPIREEARSLNLSNSVAIGVFEALRQLNFPAPAGLWKDESVNSAYRKSIRRSIMNYNKKSVEDIDVKGKRVLCRCDFNVPTKEGKITSDKRIVAAMPTIEYLVNHGARVILCSHMGKPKGEWKPELSLQVVADRLSELLGKPVVMAKDVVGEDAKAKAAALKDGDVMLLENVRFMKGETKNDPELSKELASLAEIFVNEPSARRTAPFLHGRRSGLSARCLRLPRGEGSVHHGQGSGRSDPPVRRHPRRCEGLR